MGSHVFNQFVPLETFLTTNYNGTQINHASILTGFFLAAIEFKHIARIMPCDRYRDIRTTKARLFIEMLMVKWRRWTTGPPTMARSVLCCDAGGTGCAGTQRWLGGIVRGGQGRLPEGGDSRQGLREQVAVKQRHPFFSKGGCTTEASPSAGHRLWFSLTDPAILGPEFPLSLSHMDPATHCRQRSAIPFLKLPIYSFQPSN